MMPCCMTNRTCLLTGIFDHVFDAELHGFATFFPYDVLLDSTALDGAVNVSTVASAMARGWDGRVTASLNFSPHGQPNAGAYLPRLEEVGMKTLGMPMTITRILRHSLSSRPHPRHRP